MNKCWITLTAILLCNNALAYGEAGRWSSGWGQGTSEYTAVVNEQNNLYNIPHSVPGQPGEPIFCPCAF